ncbi:hypothetical protein J6590_031111 [Homalodisca vitripennis]|nr:hypothetical protein J6590_031111 [Homalodisca vitripennis]
MTRHHYGLFHRLFCPIIYKSIEPKYQYCITLRNSALVCCHCKSRGRLEDPTDTSGSPPPLHRYFRLLRSRGGRGRSWCTGWKAVTVASANLQLKTSFGTGNIGTG